MEQKAPGRGRVAPQEIVERAPGLQTVQRGGAIKLPGEGVLLEEDLDLLG